MTTDVRTFSDLGVDDTVVDALHEAGITTPFPIQELSLPMALSGADLIGQARTGTGKTLAFGIPLVQNVDPAAGYPQALVVVPTRELCLQVHDDLVLAGSRRDIKVVAAYGGRAIDPQSEAIAAGAPIVVGTPGRLLDLCRRRMLDLSRVTMVVLDEADEMLDMGFLPDVEQLIEQTDAQRQTLLFSATVPPEVVKLARRYMRKPTFMRSDVQQQSVAPQMRQFFFACHRLDKPALVARILRSPSRGRTLIFTRTKRMADVLASELRDRDVDAGVIHSDLRQEARERALARFRKGTQDVLCATEVAARGLDIDQLTHVINYDCPDDEKMYLHRIGRTGRAGAAGIAITLAVWNELARMEMIKRALQVDEPTHEVFSTSPLLDELFGPPVEPTGRPARSNGQGAEEQRDDGQPGPDGDQRRTDGDTTRSRGRRRGGRRRRKTRQRSGGDRAPSGRSQATSHAQGDAPDSTAGQTPAGPDGRSGDRGARDDGRPATSAAAGGGHEEGAPAGGARVESASAQASGDDDTHRDDTRRDDAAGERTPRQRTVHRRSRRRRGGGRGQRARSERHSAPEQDRSTDAADRKSGGAGDRTSDGQAGAEPSANRRAATRTRHGDAPASRGRDAGGRESDAGHGAEGRAGRGPAREQRSRGGRRGRGRDRSGRGDGERTGASQQRRSDAPVDRGAHAARGNGRPTLQRPLSIDHLP